MILPFRKTAVAVIVAITATVVAALLLRSGESDGETPPAPVTERARLPAVPVREPPAFDVPGAVAGPSVLPAPLCEGCLDEQGVLDVAEGLLFYVLPDHLGLRAVPYAVEFPPDADAPSDDSGRRPLLPPGLVDAPPHFSFGHTVVGIPSEDAKDIWIVWVQTGWVPYSTLENHIERGDLPEIARSWPPLKEERAIVVHAGTGEIMSVGGITSHILSVDPTGTNLFVPGIEEARKRAAAWFAANALRRDQPWPQ